MTEGSPFSLIYNLNRLGQAADEVVFSANDAEREVLARHVEALGVSRFEAKMFLRKVSPNHFDVIFDMSADITQACVVTLEPLAAQLHREFRRELQYQPALRRAEKDITIAPEDDDLPEEIDSLHYDLAGPLVEEFVLAVDPYPRAPGVEFAPPDEAVGKPESPFAALKTLKSRPKSSK